MAVIELLLSRCIAANSGRPRKGALSTVSSTGLLARWKVASVTSKLRRAQIEDLLGNRLHLEGLGVAIEIRPHGIAWHTPD